MQWSTQSIFTCSWRFETRKINLLLSQGYPRQYSGFVKSGLMDYKSWYCTQTNKHLKMFSLRDWRLQTPVSSVCWVEMGLIKDVLQSSRSPGSGRREVKRSVVIFMHFCPVGDPEFPAQFMLGLKGQVIAFLFAYFHSMVLWHYPVVNGPFEETALLETENQRNISGKSDGYAL